MNEVRSFVFFMVWFTWTLVLGTVMVVTIPFRAAFWMMARTWMRVTLFLIRHILRITTEIRGLHHLPKHQQPYVVAVKHQSAIETFIIALIWNELLIIHKRELCFIPIFGWHLKAANLISINRSQGRKSMEQIITQIREKMFVGVGRTLVIFPEGTRTPVGEDTKYKTGIYNIVQEFNLPVYPVAVNTGLFWPKTTLVKTPGHAVFSILPELKFSENIGHKDFTAKLKATIEKETAIIVEEGRKSLKS